MESKVIKYGLIINFNKYNSYCEIIHTTFICDSLDDCKNKLINYLIDQFKNLNIDFPSDLLDFEYIYLNQNYIITNVFNYKIFYEDTWIQPWENQDIYSDLLDIIFENEINEITNQDEINYYSDSEH